MSGVPDRVGGGSGCPDAGQERESPLCHKNAVSVAYFPFFFMLQVPSSSRWDPVYVTRVNDLNAVSSSSVS